MSREAVTREEMTREEMQSRCGARPALFLS